MSRDLAESKNLEAGQIKKKILKINGYSKKNLISYLLL